MANYHASASDHSEFLFLLCPHWNFLAHQNQRCSFPPLICKFSVWWVIIICMKSNHFLASVQCMRVNVLRLTAPLSFQSSPYSLPLQMQHYSFLWMKYSHQTMDHFFSPFLSLIPFTPSFVTSISCALLSLWLMITHFFLFAKIGVFHFLHNDRNNNHLWYRKCVFISC